MPAGPLAAGCYGTLSPAWCREGRVVPKGLVLVFVLRLVLAPACYVCGARQHHSLSIVLIHHTAMAAAAAAAAAGGAAALVAAAVERRAQVLCCA